MTAPHFVGTFAFFKNSNRTWDWKCLEGSAQACDAPSQFLTVSDMNTKGNICTGHAKSTLCFNFWVPGAGGWT